MRIYIHTHIIHFVGSNEKLNSKFNQLMHAFNISYQILWQKEQLNQCTVYHHKKCNYFSDSNKEQKSLVNKEITVFWNHPEEQITELSYNILIEYIAAVRILSCVVALQRSTCFTGCSFKPFCVWLRFVACVSELCLVFFTRMKTQSTTYLKWIS